MKINELFQLNVYTDKVTYTEHEEIELWATLQYIGTEKTIEIWHGIPCINFEITNGDAKDILGLTLLLNTSSTLNQGEIYRFDYQKSGGYSERDEESSFYKDFFTEEKLYLPKGNYKIRAFGNFSLEEKSYEDKERLWEELEILVE